MEQQQNFRGNGYNGGQNRNINVNNNQGSMNARPEVVNNNNACAAQQSALSRVAKHVSDNAYAYGVGVGAVVALTGFGILAYKRGWISKKKAKEEPAPAPAAAAAEPKPAKEAAGESK